MKGLSVSDILAKEFPHIKFTISYSEFGTLYIDYYSRRSVNAEIENILKSMEPPQKSYAIQQHQEDKP